MYIYMGHLRLEDTELYEPHFYEENNIQRLQGWVNSVDFTEKKLHFSADSGHEPLSYDRLILATGSEPNRFGWPGENLKGVHGMYTLQDLQAIEDYSKDLQRAVIVGGGLIGIEMAEMFHSRNIPVSFLVREESYWNMVLAPEESQMVNEEIFEHGIDLQLGTELKEILADDKGQCRAVLTSKGEEIECGFVGLTAGVHPNVDFLRDTELEIEKGIVVDEYLKTNIEDVYAIGDCAQLASPPEGRRPIEAVWYVGKMMGETLAYTICHHPIPYDPQLWFNSAKFFNIEYQVYGQAPVSYEDELNTVFYREGKQALRIIYRKNDLSVAGVQVMGIRMRHEMCEAWIEHEVPLSTAVEQLNGAYFDPELFKPFHQKFVQHYNDTHNDTVALAPQTGLRAFWSNIKTLTKTN